MWPVNGMKMLHQLLFRRLFSPARSIKPLAGSIWPAGENDRVAKSQRAAVHQTR
jgi:hypothetical protein